MPRRALSRRATAALVALCAVATGATLVAPTGAWAAPSLTIAQVQSQINALYHKAEVSTQAYDGAQIQLSQARQSLAAVQAKVAVQEKIASSAQQAVGAIAAAAYMSGGIDPTVQLLLSSNPGNILNQASALDMVSQQQGKVMTTAKAASQQLAQDRLAVAQQVAQIDAATAEISAQKKQVLAALAQAQHVLESLKAAQRAALLAAQAAASARAAAAAQASRAAFRSAPAAAPASSPATYDTPAAPPGGSGNASAIALRVAYAQLGKPYVWGASGPGAFDCSGLTMYAFAAAGIYLPHFAASQAGYGRPVAYNNLRPGDLVFFYSPISHVGIYVGNGMMISALNPGSGVTISPMSWMPFAGAVRL
ncbi:MAG: C40 family peptidase [Actinomycetes bacterium]